MIRKWLPTALMASAVTFSLPAASEALAGLAAIETPLPRAPSVAESSRLQLAAETTETYREVTTTTTRTVAPVAPPEPRTETKPAPTSTGVVWQPGYWKWQNGNWMWVEGAYVQPPQPSAVWQPGHWVRDGNEWVWVDGRWK